MTLHDDLPGGVLMTLLLLLPRVLLLKALLVKEEAALSRLGNYALLQRHSGRLH